MKRSFLYIILISLLLVEACSFEPDIFVEGSGVRIYPDYSNITVPVNIASTNFMIQDSARKYLTVLSSGNTTIRISGRKVSIPLRKWRRITQKGNITVTVYEKKENGWNKMKPFNINIAEEIDQYLTYRIIPPLFETYMELSIVQRDISSFSEKTIYSNLMAASGSQMQCINCHSFKNWQTDNMQFHIRKYYGGTILYNQNKLSKINLKTDSTISAGVYPAWHPTHNYIAYSTNSTFQDLHTIHPNRVEVFDEASDLILYNITDNSVSIIENDSTEFECFPTWSPDGKTLYYVSAHIGNPTQFNNNGGAAAATQDIRYNLFSKPFNPDQRSWGKPRLIIQADSMKQSITLPRVSPDGNWLMFTMGSQGVFHIWHKDSELYLMNLNNGNYRCLNEINSSEVESYHSWSSNGHWVVFSSRRDDGLYTRFYLSHMDSSGKFSKPFQLPQKDPLHSSKFMYSFNIPEFTVEPVKVSARQLASFIKSVDATPVSFEQKIGE